MLTSVAKEGAPIFRLRYRMLEGGKLDTTFEMSGDGKQFRTYIKGVSVRE